jgi:hypothetical protein
MVTLAEVQKLALSFDSTSEFPHFEIISFKVKSKIFATLNKQENRACLKLSLIDQDVFSTTNKDVIYPVPNAWGKYGWTLVNLSKVRKRVLKDAMTCAYCNVAPEKLAVNYRVS